MNWLVAGYTQANTMKNSPAKPGPLGDVDEPGTGAKVSQILYDRLAVKDQERYSDYSQRSIQ